MAEQQQEQAPGSEAALAAIQAADQPEPASEGSQAQPAQTQPEPAEQAQTPSISPEEIAALRARVESLEGTGQQTPPQDDLYDLLAPGEEPGDEPQRQPRQRQQPGVQQGQQPYDEFDGWEDEGTEGPDPNLEAQLDSVIRERVAEAMYPTLQALESDRRRDALGALAQEYPDLQKQEVRDSIRSVLAPLAQQYQMPFLATDPRLVRAVYLAAQAEKFAGGEVSPEQGADQGASLETSGAASGPTSEDPDAQFKKELLSGSGGGVID